MKVLLTGAQGFVGSNLISKLQNDNYGVTTLGRSERNEYICNLSNEVPNLSKEFDIVIHAAGKAHSIPKTKNEEEEFTRVNLVGTQNLCLALEKKGLPKYFIFISTVAVYGRETGLNIRENHPLNGKTPYAKSKILAEEYLLDWATKNNITLTILRPSLIAGINPPGNLGDMIKAIEKGFYFNIAKGEARKSVLMVDDLYPIIEKSMKKGGIYNVCDSTNPSFKELSYSISEQLTKKRPKSISFFIAKTLAVIGDIIGERFPINSLKLEKITKSLTFSNSKILKETDWVPLNVIQNFKIR